MKLTDLNIGLKLELEVYNEFDELIKPGLVSQLEAVEDGRNAVISAPINEGVIYPIHIGAILNVFFIQRKEDYIFRAKVVNRGRVDNIAMLEIEITSAIIRIRRRQFFRFECTVPIKYRVVDYTNPEHDETPFKETFTRDMSGGGLCLIADEKIEAKTVVECVMILSDKRSVSFVGVVLRSRPSEFEEKASFDVGVEFKKIENRDREALIGFIFKEQRKLIKKGLI